MIACCRSGRASGTSSSRAFPNCPETPTSLQGPRMSMTEHSTASRSTLNHWTRALQYTKALETSPNRTLLSVIDEVATTHGDRLALIGENEQLTYRALVDRSSRYGMWAVERGLAEADAVCLLMPNCPDYVAIWSGITQVGCAVALINTNLVGDALAHSIRASGSRQIIVAAPLLAPGV